MTGRWLRQGLARAWAAAQKQNLDALTALSKDTVAMLLAAADAEDAPTRHGMLAEVAGVARAAAVPLAGARAAWEQHFGRSGATLPSEIVTPEACSVLHRNAMVRCEGY